MNQYPKIWPANIAKDIEVAANLFRKSRWPEEAPSSNIIPKEAQDIVSTIETCLKKGDGKPAVDETVINKWIYSLRDADFEKRQEAHKNLESIGCQAIPALMNAIKDHDPEVQSGAIEVLSILWPDHSKWTEKLQEPIKNLGKMKVGTEGAILLLIKLSSENYPYDTRYAAMEALGDIGPAAKMAVPQLIETLRGQENLRSSAAKALGKIGAEAKAAVPTLIEALRDEDENIRASAAFALGDIGPEAKEAVQELAVALKDKNPDVRWGAAFALNRMGKEAKVVVPALGDALTDEVPVVRKFAVQALDSLGPDAAEALPALIKVIKNHDDSTIIWDTIDVLVHMGPKAKTAVPALAEFEDSEPSAGENTIIAPFGYIAAEARKKAAAAIETIKKSSIEELPLQDIPIARPKNIPAPLIDRRYKR